MQKCIQHRFPHHFLHLPCSYQTPKFNHLFLSSTPTIFTSSNRKLNPPKSQRNKQIKSINMTIISRLFPYATTINRAFPPSPRSFHKEAINVMWRKPETGWTKLNYDGSCKCKTGRSSIGGIFRDENADFVLGYAQSIGPSNSTIAELAALVRGLEIALENGWTHVWLEGDSKSLIDIIAQKREARCKQVKSHVERINFFMPQIENCLLTHTYREGNRAADRFAKMGHGLKKPQIWRHVPPNELVRIVTEDAQEKTFIRRR